MVEGQWELGRVSSTWGLRSCLLPLQMLYSQHVPLQVPMSNGPSGSSPGKSEVKLELAFEYLMSKDRLQWVTITSPQVRLPGARPVVDKDGSKVVVWAQRRVLGRLWGVCSLVIPLPCRPSC